MVKNVIIWVLRWLCMCVKVMNVRLMVLSMSLMYMNIMIVLCCSSILEVLMVNSSIER